MSLFGVIGQVSVVDDVVAPPPPPPLPPPLTEEMVMAGMKNDNLKAELKRRGQSITDKKADLKERLISALRRGVAVSEVVVQRDACMNGLDVTARWELLVPNPTPVPEPARADGSHRPPTEMYGYGPVNPKYRFDEKFERHEFSGTSEKVTYNNPLPPRKGGCRRRLSPPRMTLEKPDDIADQLRLVYRMQRFHRNQKWWWALWIWGVEVSLVNTYKMMTTYCELKGVPVPYNHHDFREKVGYALLDPDNEWPGRMKQTAATPKRPVPAARDFSRKARMTAKTLSPNKGALKHRLDMDYCHLPVPPTGDVKDNNVCQLHRQANRAINKSNDIPAGARNDVLFCEACNVNLCLRCFKLYHTERDLGKFYKDILANN